MVSDPQLQLHVLCACELTALHSHRQGQDAIQSQIRQGRRQLKIQTSILRHRVPCRCLGCGVAAGTELQPDETLGRDHKPCMDPTKRNLGFRVLMQNVPAKSRQTWV